MKITELAYLESCVNQGKEKTQKVRYLKQVIMSKFKNNFHYLSELAETPGDQLYNYKKGENFWHILNYNPHR